MISEQHKRDRSKKPSLLARFANWSSETALNLIRKVVNTYRYLQHRIRDNTLSQSAKNIEDHYDLGNDMFRMFLDPTMTYSCALFEEPLKPVEQVDFRVLEEAQYRKMDALIDMLNLKPTDGVLEIGCGWGACAIRAVEKYNCDWTGLTISH
ncbi:Cyclopropane-fatty-acyl-phospholipid synthase, partial [Oesophagostomum dentatum]